MATEPLPRPRTRLYLVSPPVIPDLARYIRDVDAAMTGGDIASFQLRLKQADGSADLAAAQEAGKALVPRLQEAGIAVIVNDSPHLVRKLGADGVHLGWEDMPVKAARQMLGPDLIIGATAKNSYHRAMQAGEDGADYVAFGAFFPTRTKTATVPADTDLLEAWQAAMELPCVAIGGITPDNAASLVTAGADFIAVSSSVWTHPDGPAAGVRAFNALFDALAAATRATA